MMRGMRECRVVHPPEYDPAYAIPEDEREYGKEDWLRDVLGAKPPVRELEKGCDANSREHTEQNAVAKPHSPGHAVAPKFASQYRSARRLAAATNV
jgi:hypothetical protein